MAPSRPVPWLAALLLAAGPASLSSCAGMSAARARDDHLAKELADRAFPEECGALWPRVLRLLASRGFSLDQADRAAAGQAPLSPLVAPFTASSPTRQTEAGGLTVTTDWNREWVRYRAVGTPAGTGGCRVVFTRTTQGDVSDPGAATSYTDWDLSLALLEEVDPAGASRIREGLPR